MQNFATRYLAAYIYDNRISSGIVAERLNIPTEKLFPGTQESLTAEEFLKLCQYLRIRPENIPLE